MINKDILRFKKGIKDDGRLSQSPRDKKKKSVRRGCLLFISLSFITFIIIFYQLEKRLRAYNACSITERDAGVIVATLSDYFSLPSHTSLGPTPIIIGPGPTTRNGINFTGLSGKNIGIISGDINEIKISVSDSSGRCLMSYQEQTKSWSSVEGRGVFSITIN